MPLQPPGNPVPGSSVGKSEPHCADEALVAPGRGGDSQARLVLRPPPDFWRPDSLGPLGSPASGALAAGGRGGVSGFLGPPRSGWSLCVGC